MRILCLGAGGRISRESVKDLVDNSDFTQITIGDVNEAAMIFWEAIRMNHKKYVLVDEYFGQGGSHE